MLIKLEVSHALDPLGNNASQVNLLLLALFLTFLAPHNNCGLWEIASPRKVRDRLGIGDKDAASRTPRAKTLPFLNVDSFLLVADHIEVSGRVAGAQDPFTKEEVVRACQGVRVMNSAMAPVSQRRASTVMRPVELLRTGDYQDWSHDVLAVFPECTAPQPPVAIHYFQDRGWASRTWVQPIGKVISRNTYDLVLSVKNKPLKRYASRDNLSSKIDLETDREQKRRQGYLLWASFRRSP